VAFLSNAVAFGITYSFGMMFDGLSAEFGAGRGATATVFSFAMALPVLGGHAPQGPVMMNRPHAPNDPIHARTSSMSVRGRTTRTP
jgi:hypothetical protein